MSAFEFRARTKMSVDGTRIGLSKERCGADGCNKSGAWIATIMGHDVDVCCTQHRNEWIDAAARHGMAPEAAAA